jgi:lipopolysaccharide/colanic/teichoic acid biosynthesis glycosyltransferase
MKFINKGGEVFFTQTRTGKNANLFQIIKLKTMTDERDTNGVLLPDEKRLTKIGKFIRSTSLDELPQLLNVLRGDMSLVGPRPLLEKYIPLYSKQQFRRHEVKPGITGWAQVNGRNNISWSKKFELDVWYVENQSFWLDLKIIFMTILKVVRRKDITTDEPNTFQPFNGSN